MALTAAEEAEVAARVAALREAEVDGQKLDARLSVARTLLSSASKRLGDSADGIDHLDAMHAELLQIVEEKRRRADLLHQGNAACELRLALTRQCLADSGRKLEALRTRGAIAEELHREKTIQHGTLSERLLERREQLRELLRYGLEQRVRVGLRAWLPTHLQEDALGRWREGVARQRAYHDSLRGAVLLWKSSQLHQAVTAWQSALDRSRHASLEERRRRALRGLEQAAERRIEATATVTAAA